MPQSARGAVIVGLAVIAGIVGLQILDDSKPSNVAGGGAVAVTTLPTTTTLPPPRDPSEVRVKVYNASEVQGQAQATTDKLQSLGWATVSPGDYGSTRVGTGVQCRPGFESDAEVLRIYGVASGATVEPYPQTLPAGGGEVDCLVIEGKAA